MENFLLYQKIMAKRIQHLNQLELVQNLQVSVTITAYGVIVYF